jgi:glyceraldehyde 3-phosphate dehydrogenase
MPVRVAINGFGRIGRAVFRIGRTLPELNFVAINDRVDSRMLAHLLKYDSIQGTLAGGVESTGTSIIVDGKEIPVFSKDDPEKLPWKNLAVDVVLESTGMYTHRDAAYRHITAGAQKVVISAPGHNPDVTIIPGINTKQYNKNHHGIVSMGSCTANCLAPITKILNDTFGILYGYMTTVHSYTNNQVLLDSPHNDLRRARTMTQSIIPTTTAAIEVIYRTIPELAGRLKGISVRVPTPKVALVDFVAALSKRTSKEEVNNSLRAAADGTLKGIVHCFDEPLVSADFEGSSYSSIVDLTCTQVIGGRMVKVIAWYDNESGFSHRLCDLFPILLKKDSIR